MIRPLSQGGLFVIVQIVRQSFAAVNSGNEHKMNHRYSFLPRLNRYNNGNSKFNKMILDHISNIDKYACLHPRFGKAFEFVKGLNLETLEAGQKFEIDGKDIHASVSGKEGQKAGDAKFEAHDNYFDIQICPSANETIGWSPRDAVKEIKTPYNPEKDITFFADKPHTYFQLKAGEFAIFYPEDVHAPMIGNGLIKKLVVKIKK
jgi:biofilm protein TabA